MTEPINAPALIPAIAILGAHGLKGHLRAKCLLADASLLSGTLPTSRQGVTLTLVKVQPQPGGMLLLNVAESTSRTTAEDLRGVTMFLQRESLPAAAEDEVYLHDLLTRPVHNQAGEPIGSVLALKSTGAQDLLEIGTATAAVLIPAHADFFEDLGATPLVLSDLGQQLVDL